MYSTTFNFLQSVLSQGTPAHTESTDGKPSETAMYGSYLTILHFFSFQSNMPVFNSLTKDRSPFACQWSWTPGVLFLPQALADKIGVGCSLVRGEYSRGWNEVKLVNEARKGIIGNLPPPDEYIVDLMFHPGTLLKLRSKEADLYRFL